MANLEFLAIYDCTEQWNALVAQGGPHEGFTNKMEFYGIQRDVKDYHVFRLYREPGGDIFVLEHELLPVRKTYETIRSIMERDIDKGLDSWECEEHDDKEAAIERITQDGFYNINAA